MLNSFTLYISIGFQEDLLDCISSSSFFPMLDEVIRLKANCKSSSRTRTKCTFPVIAQSYGNAIDKSFDITLDLKSKKRFCIQMTSP